MISNENFNVICRIWILVGIIVFPVLLKVTQPYGKHSKESWGPMIDNRLGWLIMELPALLVFAVFFSAQPNLNNRVVLAAGLLWGLHYIHRAIIFPFRLRTKGKKMPVVIVFSAILFNTVNGFLNGYWLSHFAPHLAESLFADFRLIFAVFIFLTGFFINQYHDRILIQLRKDQSKGYQIPNGGWFKWISCPNYLGELISWLGFFILTLGLPAFSFFIWTLVNLLPRALDNHKWYKEKFPEYPVGRKAILPFLL